MCGIYGISGGKAETGEAAGQEVVTAANEDVNSDVAVSDVQAARQDNTISGNEGTGSEVAVSDVQAAEQDNTISGNEGTDSEVVIANGQEVHTSGGIGALVTATSQTWENAAYGESASSGAEEDSWQEEYENFAIADVSDYVNVRTEPNTGSEIVGKMYDGAVAQILQKTSGEDGEWLQIISGEVEGYIKAQYFIYGEDAVEAIDDYVTRYAVIKADRLNVRKEPDITAQRIGYVDFEEKIPIIEALGEWIKVQYATGQEGYVAAEYVTVSEEFVYAKSLEEERAELEAMLAMQRRQQESESAAPESTIVAVPPAQTSFGTNAELRAAIIADAMQYLGNRYVHGGRSLASGTDCSGFTCYIYADFGYSISRTPAGQLSSAGRSISYEEAQPGDIICYTSNGSRCTHVALYLGNDQIIHAANSRKGVIISNAKYSTIMGVKNLID